MLTLYSSPNHAQTEPNQLQIDQDGIRRLIPHAGAMCLLERVEAWDATRIRCASASHHRADNPLREGGSLRAICGVEYAAQAIALHGALGAGQRQRSRAGLLVSLRSVVCAVADLDGEPGELTVEAERLLGEDEGAMYAFRVLAGARELLSGRATVVLDAAALAAARG
jgi:predicted hotdog family 3-hydroxylacyl-ACP dehydratase